VHCSLVKSSALAGWHTGPVTEPSARRARSQVRAKVRAAMADEIKRTARRHLAEHGASMPALRAVARELGFVSSAVYRYFASRDELLTALILDAYNGLGETAEQAEAAVDRTDFRGRLAAICHATRDWARANPHEYALIYGSPVPGYHAPQDTIGPATRVANLLGRVLVDAAAAGALRRPDGPRLPPALADELARLAAASFPGVTVHGMVRGLMLWTELFGTISFELFGHYDGVIGDRDAWFAHQIATLGDDVGLPRPDLAPGQPTSEE
jgi:AcrR family transcriptional regulator